MHATSARSPRGQERLAASAGPPVSAHSTIVGQGGKEDGILKAVVGWTVRPCVVFQFRIRNYKQTNKHPKNKRKYLKGFREGS